MRWTTIDLTVKAVPKPSHKRNAPKRKARGEFSPGTILNILERDNYACVKCGSNQLENRPHHITFRSQGGTGTEDNGVAICISCHRWAHSCREGREWFERYRESHLIKR